ncbi:hypothetical protein ACOMHN_012516 [Nucella lapillus]
MGASCSRSTPQKYLHNNNTESRGLGGNTKVDHPPIQPSGKTKSRIIPTTDSYEGLQSRVKNISTFSVETLTASLTRDCPDDLHKVRAFFCWIAANITYDVGALGRNDVKSQEPETVRKTRQAVCQGYSQLFCALCRHANIPCLLVSGLDKGLDYDPETIFTPTTKTNHAWNIVYVKGEWRPLDVTWGSGHLDESRRFQRKLTEHWFLTDPAEFITDHFPLLDGNVKASEKYQLLKRPITLERFSAVLCLKSVAYDLGLGVQGLSHTKAIIRVRRDVTITLRASTRQPLETVRVTLSERGRSGSTASCSAILTSLDVDGTCKIYVRPPRAGKYVLDVKGKGGEQEGSHVSQLLSYVIICTNDYPQPEPYPDKEEPWGLQRPQAMQCGLKAAKNKPFYFKANRQGEVRVAVPLAKPNTTRNNTAAVPIATTNATAATPMVTLVQAELRHAKQMNQKLSQYIQVEYTDNSTVIITARLPSGPGYYMLRVFAGKPSNNQSSRLQHCADYLLHCTTTQTLTADICPPFPESLRFAREHRVQLLSPRSAHVPAGQRSRYRVRAPALGQVRVGDMKMVRKGGGVWEGEVTPAGGVKDILVYGAVDPDSRNLDGLFKFTVK